MNHAQSIELLNATHDFPCPYMIKVIGLSADGFVERIVEAVQEALGDDDEPAYTLRRTPGGKHVAITLEPVVASAEDVLIVYESIRAVSGIVLTM